MLNNPFEAIHSLLREKTIRDRDTIQFVFSQTDSFVTWIIGFSVAALALIVPSLTSLFEATGKSLAWVILLLTMATCFGILFRYFSYYVMLQHKKLEDYFAGVFSNLKMTPIEIDDEIDGSSYEEILFRLKNDFAFDAPFDHILTEDQKSMELPHLIDHYKRLCSHSKKQYDLAIEYIAEINEDAYKIKKAEFIKKAENIIEKKKVGFRLVPWASFVGLLYFLCIFSFMGAIILACIGLINKLG